MATFIAGDGVGAGSVDATLDNATVTATITIVAISTLKVMSLHHTDSPPSNIITFVGGRGMPYAIQSTPSLSEPWVDLSPEIVADAAGLGVYTNLNPASILFYRVRLLQ